MMKQGLPVETPETDSKIREEIREAFEQKLQQEKVAGAVPEGHADPVGEPGQPGVPAPARIVVDDGTEVIEVANRQGKVLGRFVFRPADMGIVDRWNAMVDDFDRVIEPIEALGDEEPDQEAGFAALAEAKDRLCAALDKAFDGNVSEAFFAGVHPFAMVNGTLYCENVMNAVAAYMTSRFEEEFKHVNARQNPKVAGYINGVRHGTRTGRHAGGRK